MLSIDDIQAVLRSYGIDAWFLYDFRGSNSIAWQVLGLAPDAHCTRRWLVVIPAEGAAVKIVSTIERHTLAHIPATEMMYTTRQEWTAAVTEQVLRHPRVAMEYSAMGDLPVVAKVDAGTVEWLRNLGADIVSSGDVAQHFTSVLSPAQLETSKQTAKDLRAVMHDTFRFIREALMVARNPLDEVDVQRHAAQLMEERNLVTDHPAIVAVGPNAANPHYAPRAGSAAPIGNDDLILVDMWARPHTSAVYSDITWMAYTGKEVPQRAAKMFAVLAQARDAVVDFLRESLAAGRSIQACQLDDIARDIINAAGYGQYFVHRTGHNISTELHGPGANLDNFETRDTRRILPLTSFSVEPGIYIPGDIGMRSELDVLIGPDYEVIVSGGEAQEAIIPLLASRPLP